MTNPDYRAMCTELVDSLHKHTSMWEGHEIDLVARARALLDQPVAEGPTDEDLEDLADVMNVSGNPVPAMRRALELWGRSMPQPVAVSERLPGPEDCDEQGRCWMFGNIEGDWRLISTINPGIPKLKYCFSHWLPANALPTPEAK